LSVTECYFLHCVLDRIVINDLEVGASR
jgi:hypothetical protein